MTVARRGVWLACLALSLCGGVRQAFALSVGNSQPLIQQVLAPGEAVQGTIELVNNGDEPLQVKAYLEDWQYTPSGDGDKQFASPQTLPRSCAGWVRFFPQEFELPAQGRALVDYTLRVPPDQPLDGGYYAVLFFEAGIGEGPAEATDVPRAVVRFAARLGSLFFVDVKGTTRRDARLSILTATPPSVFAPLTLEATLANEGNAVLVCESSFHVLSPENVAAGRGELPRRYLWPGARVALAGGSEVGSLASGTYTVVVTADCGEELVIVEEAPLAVP